MGKETNSPQLQTYLDFLHEVENLNDDPRSYERTVHPEAQFNEFPNLLNRGGQVRDLARSMAGLKTAKTILARQHYEIAAATEQDDRIVVEKIWTGEMAADVGPLKKGQVLKAYICAVIEFKDGKIYRHRTYDCYEPFE